jgi:phosphotransferase system  glucose/maltose/N-acetylglucosamine-specific IIC component
MLTASSVKFYHCVWKNLCKGEAHMDALNAVKSWIGALTDVVLMLLALAIVCAMLVGANLPFFGNVVGNIMGLVGELGKNGLVGLIALGIILWLFANRRMA